MYPRSGLCLVVCAALTACGGGKRPEPPAVRAPADWRQVATAADRERLRSWRTTWMQATRRAQAAGGGQAIAAQGVLLLPDRALAAPMPPPGDYRCRVFKLGVRGGVGAFAASPPADCRIDRAGALSRFSRTGGSQRPVGWVFPDDETRAIFLGTMMFGDERTPLDYGRDADRDMAGIVQRVGERRWRMILPAPRFESMLDVIELVPAG